MYYYTGPANHSCIPIGPPFTNAITSVWNRFSINHVTFYTGSGCSGGAYTVGPGQQINFLSWPHADSFESLEIYDPDD